MNREELLQSLTDLGTIEDPAERRSRIVSISDEIGKVFDTNADLTASNTKLQGDNQKLKDYNMELYLQVGSKKPPEKTDNKEEKLSYDNLFNEKGELK